MDLRPPRSPSGLGCAKTVTNGIAIEALIESLGPPVSGLARGTAERRCLVPRAAVRLKIDRRSAITHSIRVCTDASYWIGRFVIRCHFSEVKQAVEHSLRWFSEALPSCGSA